MILKCRQKVLHGKLREHLGNLVKDLARQQGCGILERHLRLNHVHFVDLDSAKVFGDNCHRLHQGKIAMVIALTCAGLARISSFHQEKISTKWLHYPVFPGAVLERKFIFLTPHEYYVNTYILASYEMASISKGKYKTILWQLYISSFVHRYRKSIVKNHSEPHFLYNS